ncbi:MAG: NAD-binding protein [Labilithrix sp.]|nr:NAD-binding protein [Labilithrix sp.]MCW5811039.1 NAD-binding protein [Labilithrix sp.]
MFDRIVLIGAGRTSGSIVDRLARIAPLTILDLSPAAIDLVSTRELESSEGSHPIVKRLGDGTSRLVLEDVRGDPKSLVALVVAPGDDRAALEATKLGAELGYAPVVTIVNDRTVAQACEKHQARAFVRAEIVGQLVEQTLQQGGLGVTSAGGFGRGDVVEFTVLPSSPAIGVPLAKLRADGWRIAAIYRGDELVLPTGLTTIAADDRVLVVGDPRQLPHVAESLRVGLPTFPLLQGPHIVVYLPGGRDGDVEAEAEMLLERTRAARLVRAYPGAERTRVSTGAGRKHIEDVPLEGSSIASHLPILRARTPGVVVARIGARPFADVLLGRGGEGAVLCNEAGAPVLFPRGASRHERVVLCLTDGDVDLATAEVALDLARMYEVPLHVLRVKLPAYLQSEEAATAALVDTIVQRARLHGVQPEVLVLEGNPIAEWVKASERGDLAVVARRPGMRDSFSKPDLALRLARKAKGSVLVFTVPA